MDELIEMLCVGVESEETRRRSTQHDEEGDEDAWRSSPRHRYALVLTHWIQPVTFGRWRTMTGLLRIRPSYKGFLWRTRRPPLIRTNGAIKAKAAVARAATESGKKRAADDFLQCPSPSQRAHHRRRSLAAPSQEEPHRRWASRLRENDERSQQKAKRELSIGAFSPFLSSYRKNLSFTLGLDLPEV